MRESEKRLNGHDTKLKDLDTNLASLQSLPPPKASPVVINNSNSGDLEILIENLRKEIYASFVTHNHFTTVQTKVEFVYSKVENVERQVEVTND